MRDCLRTKNFFNKKNQSMRLKEREKTYLIVILMFHQERRRKKSQAEIKVKNKK
jgi:hypothetical protein